MNNDITEDYCSFEVSQLLKEKGFRVPTDGRFYYKDYYTEWTFSEIGAIKADNRNQSEFGSICSPTHSLAIKK